VKCPKCRTENLETRKFCKECGTKLLLICPDCHFENTLGDKFCGECGNHLGQLKKIRPPQSSQVDYTAPQSYTPKHLAEKTLTSRSAIEGERKIVTVMFAHVVGSTTLSEKLYLEDRRCAQHRGRLFHHCKMDQGF
jgi:hypothetical protein